MQPQILTDSQGNNPLSTGKEEGGWKRIETADDGIGPGRGEALPRAISKLPRPRILTQRKPGKNPPIGIHRKEIGRQEYPEVANPPAYAGFGQPQSQGVGQYYYAPNEGNLTPSIAWRSGLLLADVGRGGGESAIYTGDSGSKGQWSDSDLAVELGEDGYPRYDSDSNFARRPRTWRFKTRDKDVSMLPQRNQISSPEPPDQFDVGNESLIYPLTGSFIRGTRDVEINGVKYHYGKPKPIGSYDPGDPEALMQVPVSDFDKDGKPSDEPLFDLRFWMIENPKSPGKAVLNTSLAVEVYEYPAGEEPFPKVPPIVPSDNAQAAGVIRRLPVEVLTEAAEAIGFEYQGAESKAEEHREAVTDLEKKMGELFPPDKIAAIAAATEGMKKGDRDDYLRSLGRDLIHQAGAVLPGATAEDVAKFLREALAKAKVEAPEEGFKAPDFGSVPAGDLGKYMFKDHRARYAKLPESEQNEVRKLAAESLGDASASGATETEIKEKLGEIVDAATAKAPEEKRAEPPAGGRKMPSDMEPQEKLFRDVEGWMDDYQTYAGDEIKPEVARVLEKKPEGEGKYFKWEYGKPSEGQDATLVIIRKPAWKDFQAAI